LTEGPSIPPSTVVVARLASGSLRRQENGDESRGWLTTTRELLVPETVVDRPDESAKAVPPSTTGTSHIDPYWTVLGTVVPGGHAALG
jgi:hypothetical protein